MLGTSREGHETVLTHARLGLGVPYVKLGWGCRTSSSAWSHRTSSSAWAYRTVKFGLGAPDVKFGLGAPDVKFGLGRARRQVRSGFGAVAVATGADGVLAGTAAKRAPSPGSYSRVARSLQLLEELRRRSKTWPWPLTSLPRRWKSRQQLLDRIARVFREFEELLAHAKQTARWFWRTRTYGLGPGPQHGLGSAERLELAAAGGFGNSR